MGLITIKCDGSFGGDSKIFLAVDHGHAHAINEAQKWLNEKMREAINLDHRLRDREERPGKGFQKEK